MRIGPIHPLSLAQEPCESQTDEKRCRNISSRTVGPSKMGPIASLKAGKQLYEPKWRKKPKKDDPR